MRSPNLDLSGERFSAVYHLTGSEKEARTQATQICIEQTVEFPADLLPPGDIPDQIVGRVERFDSLGPDCYEAKISYAIEVADDGLPQLLNVVFGNISIKPGIRLDRLCLPESLLKPYRGPRFGRSGLRTLLNVERRPLLCSALKPMGLSVSELARLGTDFARGGVDLLKDDHGLVDQSFCRFQERVGQCAEAINQASSAEGTTCLYCPNVTAPSDQIRRRIHFAKEAGAGGLLISPGLIGLDVMKAIAQDDDVGLPIMCHPAILGSYVVGKTHGMSHFALFGQILRLAGADACIFPNYGGRFAFSEAECRCLVEGTAEPMGHIKTSFPTPAGGMHLGRIDEMLSFYGNDMILLIGGDLHRHGNLVDACRQFRALVEA